MAKWSVHLTRNTVALGLSRALTTCRICSQFSEFKPSAMLVEANWLPPASTGF